MRESSRPEPQGARAQASRLQLCRKAGQHHLRKEENILLHDICVWPERPTQLSSGINPCNKLLPHISQIKTVVGVYNWSQSQVSRES